jgi:hypothetical protein
MTSRRALVSRVYDEERRVCAESSQIVLDKAGGKFILDE